MSLMRVVAAVLFLTSCREPGTSSEGASAVPTIDESPPLLMTDSAVYTLQWDGRGWFTTIGFEYQNSSGDTLYVVNCNQHVTLNVQKRDSLSWTDFWYGATDACLSAPIEIAPGATYQGELSIWGAPAGNTSTTAFLSDDFADAYRLKWNQLMVNYTGRPPRLGDTLPEARRVSNNFKFRLRKP
jgi:hypothetical protein